MFESLTQRLSGAFSFLSGSKELTEENIDQGLAAVRQGLLEADVHFKVTKDFVASVRERALGAEKLKGVDASDQFVHACHEELVELMGPEDARLEFAKSGPTVILMAGLQGAGKTTTCAKLARHLRDKHQKRPLLVAADVKRPAAIEQLQILGRQIDVPVHAEIGVSAPDVCKSAMAAARAGSFDVVILDTAGRLHVDDEMMAEVEEIARRTEPHNQVLVVDAMTGQDAVRSASAFHERLSLSGVILTKLDGDARGGAALSIKAVTGRPILFAGVGEKIDDLDAFSPERMAGRILGMGDVVGLVETAAENISEEEAQASYEKLVMGSFTLEDMLAQLRMIQKLGPMKKVLGMIPGLGSMVDQIDTDDKRIKRLEALFTSMTPKERLHPEILDMNRRRRVARGAGQDVGAMNELLKSFKGMKKMMKEMNKMGLGSMLGAKGKRAALKDMSPTGELAAPGAGGGGGLLGGLGSLFGGGGAPTPGPDAAGMPGGAGLEDLASAFGAGARPAGSSSTRKQKPKRKPKKKGSRKNRRR